MKMDKNHHLLKYTLTGDTILLGDVDINVLDSTNLNILHTFEGHTSSVINLEIVDKNQLLSLSNDGNVRSWLLQVQIQDDEDDDEIIDFKVNSEEKKMMGLSGIASLGYLKDDIVPVPPTSAGIFGSDSQLIYFSSFSSHDIYENKIPRIYKDLLVIYLKILIERIVCHQTLQILNWMTLNIFPISS
jgi:WD40 repeat protein